MFRFLNSSCISLGDVLLKRTRIYYKYANDPTVSMFTKEENNILPIMMELTIKVLKRNIIHATFCAYLAFSFLYVSGKQDEQVVCPLSVEHKIIHYYSLYSMSYVKWLLLKGM